jgi:glycosyltransferase involved in cell wall biosynthesis
VNKSSNLIVILDVAGRILDSEETVERHNTYARELDFNSNSSLQLLIISLGKHESKTKHLQQIDFELIRLPMARNNILGFAFHAFKNLKNRKVVGFVCGDPWESYWLSIWFKKISFKTSRIQLQLHGDFGSGLWSKDSLKLKIRQRLINLKSKSIDSLRFTSKNQQLSIQGKFKINCENQVVIPVPLNIPNEIFSQTDKVQLEIGLVGRLHLERGLDTFITFAEVVHTKYPGAQFKIIGNGKKIKWFKEELKRRIPESKLNFIPHLSGSEYFRAIGELSILCSFAPSESYGRVAREALALGVPILAVHSAGMDALAESFPHNIIHFMPDLLENETIIDAFEAALDTNVPSNLLEVFKESNQRVISDLIESWIKMVRSE